MMEIRKILEKIMAPSASGKKYNPLFASGIYISKNYSVDNLVKDLQKVVSSDPIV